jgi:hypothetical protein
VSIPMHDALALKPTDASDRVLLPCIGAGDPQAIPLFHARRKLRGVLPALTEDACML